MQDKPDPAPDTGAKGVRGTSIDVQAYIDALEMENAMLRDAAKWQRRRVDMLADWLKVMEPDRHRRWRDNSRHREAPFGGSYRADHYGEPDDRGRFDWSWELLQQLSAMRKAQGEKK